MNAKTKRIVELLRQHPPLKQSEIADMVGVDRRWVYQVRLKYANRESVLYRDFDPKKLIYYRSELAMSLRALAEKADVHVSQISRWERGLSSPWEAQWKKIARALGVKPEDLRKQEA